MLVLTVVNIVALGIGEDALNVGLDSVEITRELLVTAGSLTISVPLRFNMVLRPIVASLAVGDSCTKTSF